ncbi:phosphosulfolactate synthase [Amycolatopsis pigmentata]|uniref:Phosphosulfolactate synthase n=1 Tax=Amycolatopsis pigmentata TaxID=450801 RepID=A0ABW5G335_9PSEU
MLKAEHDLSFLRMNQRPAKPATMGITEVRGPFYNTFGPAHLDDYLVAAAPFVDWVKIPAPSVILLPPEVQRKYIDVCHAHDVEAGAGGAIEWVVTRGAEAVERYFEAIKAIGYDVVEVSAGMLAIPDGDFVRLVRRAKATGLKVKAEVGIQFGAGGTSSEGELERAGSLPVNWAIKRAVTALDAGADYIVLESEGVTESVTTWRTDVPAAFVAELGLERIVFEAADPSVYAWYIKTFGPEVNLFIDQSQAIHLESLRSGVWGTSDLWGRIVTYKTEPGEK